LKGSAYHAAGARRIGLPIVAVINNDIVGGVAGADAAPNTDAVRLFSRGDDGGPSRRLARYVASVADRYAGLEAKVIPQGDRPGRGGDHQSFSVEGYPAVRVIAAQEDTERQHSPRDTPAGLDPAYQAAVVRLDLAVVASLALAPPEVAAAPVVQEAAGGVAVRWAAVDHPAVAGYWLATRARGDGRYTLARWVSGATEATLAMEPDPDLRVVVATSDARGHMSLFSPEGSP
ncbi:MAG: M28 family peptidase, partial [Anaerolineae bacterium]